MEDNLGNQLEHLVQSLKQAKPILKDPGHLTDSIMDRIDMSSERKATPLLVWVRAALSTAAALLFGLFVFQQAEAEKTTANTTATFVIENTIQTDSTCMKLLDSEQSSIVKTYLCYLQQNSIENKLNKSYPMQKN